MDTLEVYDIAIGIERRLSNMYHRFSTLFKENTEIQTFWIGIANHEKSHSETLTLSKGYLMWNHPSIRKRRINLIQHSDTKELETLEYVLKEYERKIRRERVSLQEALDILLKIENSELNHLYKRLINLSGFKLLPRPENSHRFIYEHMKTIKSFMDKYYRGNQPAIQVEDYADETVLSSPLSEVLQGKIVEIESEMSYGFIEGKDGERYMFLPEDISSGTWEDVKRDTPVEFSSIRLPWGPRANNIRFRK
ncbi:MAG: hypothetical protein A2Y48_04915 [Nitrospirae bacterium RIFCSPLOW2_12_42_9]|nr:MAG: hypothetical protein A2Y48_04915 [Nitrospirae bacterium RIFCSPLOW2_12_42_9]